MRTWQGFAETSSIFTYYFLLITFLLHSVCEGVDVVVAYAEYADEDDASDADEEGEACIAVGAERGNGGIDLLYVHGLHDEQVVVE